MRKSAFDLSGLPLRTILAKNIRMARIANGMSQEALADEAGLDRAFVGSLERGTRNISIDNVERLASAVRVPAHDLLNPQLAADRGYDPTMLRVPRTARQYSVKRRKG